MSLGSTVNRNQYTGNGTTNTYNYGFKIFNEDHLLVVVQNVNTLVETTLTKTTDYTVTGVDNTSGGTIVLVNGGQAWLDGANLSSDYKITIRRVVPLLQETDIRNQGDFFAETHEDTFDLSRMIDQQQQDEIDRSAKLPESVSSSDFNPELPGDIQQADRALIVNSTADGFDMGPTANEIANAQANATAAAASAAAAATSESNAATSETNAAASATAAANAVDSAQWQDVRFITFADSPVAVVDADSGTMFSVDTSGGAVVFNLPQISTLTLTSPWSIGVKKATADGNGITINRAGTDDIDDGQTSVSVSVHNSGKVLIPDADPTPDNWTTFGFAEASAVPTGSMQMFAGASAPTGYLICDGAAVSRTTYANLFAVLGTAWGEGDGSTTFHLPDMRGRVPRGVDSGAGRDPDAAGRTASNTNGNTGDNVGSVQADQFDSHTHTNTPHTHTTAPHDHSYTTAQFTNGGTGVAGYANQAVGATTGPATVTVNSASVAIDPAGGNETRMKNANVNFIIKT